MEIENLTMGQKVIVNAITIPQYIGDNDNERRWIVKIIKKRTGWYVGYTYKQEGRIIIDDFNYLKISKTVKLARVKFSNNSNDAFVSFEHIRLNGGN